MKMEGKLGRTMKDMLAILLAVLVFANVPGAISSGLGFLGGLASALVSLLMVALAAFLLVSFDGKKAMTLGGIGFLVSALGFGLAGLAGFGISLIAPTIVVAIGATLVLLDLVVEYKP